MKLEFGRTKTTHVIGMVIVVIGCLNFIAGIICLATLFFH